MPGRTLARCANCCTRCERRSYSEPNPKFRVERRAVCRPDQRRKQCFSPVDPSSVKALSRESKQSLNWRSEEHTSELQSLTNLVCRLLLEKKNNHRHMLRLSRLFLPDVIAIR